MFVMRGRGFQHGIGAAMSRYEECQRQFKRKAEELAELRAGYDEYEREKLLPKDVLPLTMKDVKFLKDCGIATT